MQIYVITFIIFKITVLDILDKVAEKQAYILPACL